MRQKKVWNILTNKGYLVFNSDIVDRGFNDETVDFLMAFPVCTDLAICGNSSKKLKLALNKNVEIEATQHAINCADLANRFDCPSMIENLYTGFLISNKDKFILQDHHAG